jgi:hypothetical protein
LGLEILFISYAKLQRTGWKKSPSLPMELSNFFIDDLNTNYDCTFIDEGDIRPKQPSHNMWKAICYVYESNKIRK